MTDTDCTSVMSESDSQPEFFMSSPKVASIVRKELAVAIRDLMQHGLIAVRLILPTTPPPTQKKWNA